MVGHPAAADGSDTVSHETTFELGVVEELGQSLLAHVSPGHAPGPDKRRLRMWRLDLSGLEDIKHERKHRQAVFA